MKLFKLLFLILFSMLAANPYSHAANIDYIIDTDLGGDVDDVLALLVSLDSPIKPLAITTTHIEPREKAKIAKLVVTVTGFSEIPVYAGVGTTRDDPRALFLQQNPLWPPSFGYPNLSPGETQWYTQQAMPYKKMNNAMFEKMNIEEESAPEFIVRIAKTYSPDHKLVIVALGPLHNIAAALKIDPSIGANLKLFSMGGVYPKGYNWLTSPEVTAPVLASVETVSIVSQFIIANDFYITPEEFIEIEKNINSEFGLAVIQDWKNWYKIDSDHLYKTHLSDPVTLYLALHPEEMTSIPAMKLTFPCLDADNVLSPEFANLWYNMPGLDNKIMRVEEIQEGQVRFVSGVQSPSTIKKRIVSSIKKFLSR